MSERYVKVFSGKPNLYAEGALVVILASALLKDTETGKMIAQLKFQNISGKVITYVKVAVTPLDAIQNALGDAAAFEYLDISAADKEDFGAKQPLVLPNASTRAFDIKVTCVGFADDTVWTSDTEAWKAEEEGSALSKEIETETTYKKALELSKSKDTDDVTRAIEIFKSIQTEKDVTKELSACDSRIAYLTSESSKKKKKVKRIVLLAVSLVLVALLGYFVGYPMVSYWSGDYSVYINMYQVKEFKIPDGVTEITPEMFRDNDIIESVIIPDSVTIIGEGAFSDCDNLTSIHIPGSVTTIAAEAFRNCSNLTDVTFGEGVRHIEQSAFYGCSNITSIVIPDSVVRVGEAAFANCWRLLRVTLGCGVTRIRTGTFSGTDIRSITMTDNVQTIEEYGLHGLDGNTTIHYNGTKEQWEKISKSDDWKSRFDRFTVHCTDGDIQY